MSYQRTARHRSLLAEQCRNRRPWEKSTGPKSDEGKSRVSRNAYKGGVRQQLRELASLLRAHSKGLDDFAAAAAHESKPI